MIETVEVTAFGRSEYGDARSFHKLFETNPRGGPLSSTDAIAAQEAFYHAMEERREDYAVYTLLVCINFSNGPQVVFMPEPRGAEYGGDPLQDQKDHEAAPPPYEVPPYEEGEQY